MALPIIASGPGCLREKTWVGQQQKAARNTIQRLLSNLCELNEECCDILGKVGSELLGCMLWHELVGSSMDHDKQMM